MAISRGYCWDRLSKRQMSSRGEKTFHTMKGLYCGEATLYVQNHDACMHLETEAGVCWGAFWNASPWRSPRKFLEATPQASSEARGSSLNNADLQHRCPRLHPNTINSTEHRPVAASCLGVLSGDQ